MALTIKLAYLIARAINDGRGGFNKIALSAFRVECRKLPKNKQLTTRTCGPEVREVGGSQFIQ